MLSNLKDNYTFLSFSFAHISCYFPNRPLF